MNTRNDRLILTETLSLVNCSGPVLWFPCAWRESKTERMFFTSLSLRSFRKCHCCMSTLQHAHCYSRKYGPLVAGEERVMCRVLVGKPEGRRPLGRPRRRCVDNIRMDLQEVGCGYMDWIGLAQDTDRWRTLVIAVMNLRSPWNAGNFLTSCKPVSFSRRTLHHGVSK